MFLSSKNAQVTENSEPKGSGKRFVQYINRTSLLITAFVKDGGCFQGGTGGLLWC